MSPSSVIPVCSQLHLHLWHRNAVCKERGDAWLQWWEQPCPSQRRTVAPLKTQRVCTDPVFLWAVLVLLENPWPHRAPLFSLFLSFVLFFLLCCAPWKCCWPCLLWHLASISLMGDALQHCRISELLPRLWLLHVHRVCINV